MKSIAYWSRDHKAAARSLIAFCHIIIFCLACYVGVALKETYIFISPLSFWISTGLFIVVWLLFSRPYPSFSFYKKKIIDGLLLLVSFIMIVSFANQKNIGNVTTFRMLNASFSEQEHAVSRPTGKPSMKELKKQWRELKKAAKRDSGASAGGVVLAIVVGALLGVLVAGASCSLSCNGQDALAILTVLGGAVAIFFICRWLIKATRNRSKDKINATPPLGHPSDNASLY